MRIFATFFITFFCYLGWLCGKETPFVTSHIPKNCSLEECLFRVSQASAIAWDNNAKPIFPQLLQHKKYLNFIFSRVNISHLPSAPKKRITLHQDQSISLIQDTEIMNYLTSEKIFMKYKTEILNLLSPSAKVLEYLKSHYSYIINHPYTIGFHFPQNSNSHSITENIDLLKKAYVTFFGDDGCIIIITDDAQQCNEAITRLTMMAKDGHRTKVPKHGIDIIVIEEKNPCYALYLMSMCKHQVLSWSGFSWWAAYLNTNPNKRVIYTKKITPPQSEKEQWFKFTEPFDFFIIKHQFGVNQLQDFNSKLPPPQPYVSCILRGQLGNQLFRIAATCAVAWKNQATPLFPQFTRINEFSIPLNFENVFWRMKSINRLPSLPTKIHKTDIDCLKVKYQPNLIMDGVFESEAYFLPFKDEIKELFAPSVSIQEYLNTNYPHIISHPKTVGIHVRYMFVNEQEKKPVYGYKYLGSKYFLKAMDKFFPDNDILFVVFSDKPEHCKTVFAESTRNIIFVHNENHCLDFYLLSLCKHQIICESSFSWWAAYLNPNPLKKVIYPTSTIHPLPKPISEGSKWFSLDIKNN